MKIGIYGSAAPDMDASVVETAKALGTEIALRKHTVVTGACPGIPHEVAAAAMRAGGKAIGYSPSCNLEQHIAEGNPAEGYELVYLSPDLEKVRIQVRYKLRNISSVEATDAAIFVSGRIGTLNEYTLAYDLGKPFAALLGTGGAADALPEIARMVTKQPQPFMLFSADYLEILDALEKASSNAE